MATFTSEQVASGRTYQPLIGGTGICTAYGAINIAANPADGDIYEMIRLPKGAIVVDGALRAADLDTGAEALDMDIGWAANGAETADPDGFGNLDVLTGDTSVHIPVAGIFIPFQGVLITTGPQKFTNETILQVEANVTATTGGTGRMWMLVHYTFD